MEISDNEFKESLGKRIKSIRTGRNLGVRKFSQLADIEHHQLLRIEKGLVDIRLSTLRKIAIALNVKESYLLNLGGSNITDNDSDITERI
ncbi:helix-turn-helix domain-containing protein [Mucilaginibacter aquariorum]|uniref:Helix-turn-helix domain-containing protein n=1 Tax=Mucilaginibacter aquariorum TaxID=2967225 RepID=A0ABT1SY74_9SPHI|nr:helix-turn-helix transcriptional regulator [Mucilaginibacter aquariorum]MCQ6957300.1 helix-turn-helix domain-containing protein [Mucilaginibacter aquariorum]